MSAAEKKDDSLETPGGGIRLKSKAVSVVLYVGFLVLILGGVEVAARMLGSRAKDPNLRRTLIHYNRLAHEDTGHFRFVADSELPYRLKAGFEFRSRDGLELTRHNDAGFRDSDDFPPKTGGTLRIVCLGGSTTYGVRVTDNYATYPAALERFLNGKHRPEGWDRVEVFNLGVGGYTSLEVLANLRLHGLPLQPDIVLIQSGLNDVAPRFYPGFECSYRHFRKPLTLPAPGLLARLAYRSRLVLILGWKLDLIEPLTLQSRTQYPMPSTDKALANLAANGTDCLVANLRAATELARKAGARVWLLTQAYLDDLDFVAPEPDLRRLDEGYHRGLREHNEVIRDVAMSLDTGLVDLESMMPLKRSFFADPIHMSEEGNEMKAKLIAESISSALSRMLGTSTGVH